MLNSLLITLREGLEAALIIGIILGYLSKVNQKQLGRYIYAGVGLGVLASILAAYIFEVFAGGFEGKSEQIFEGVVMLVAVAILTSMILWMNRQSKSLKSDIQQKIDSAIGGNQIFGLVSLAFVSVFREGIEIVLFMNASIFSSSKENSLIGGILGLVMAMAIAYLVFKTTANLDLKKFFLYTGIFIIFISAGLFTHGLHEFAEAGVIPVVIGHLWDINNILSDKGTIGSFLRAVFGYSGDPSLVEVVGYAAYLIIVLKFFLSVKKIRNIS